MSGNASKGGLTGFFEGFELGCMVMGAKLLMA